MLSCNSTQISKFQAMKSTSRMLLHIIEFGMCKFVFCLFLICGQALCDPKPHIIFPSPNLDYHKCVIPHTQQHGTCVKYSNCYKAQFDLRVKQIQPTTCYFERFDSFVCCAEQMSYLLPAPNSWPLQSTPPILSLFEGSWPPQNPSLPSNSKPSQNLGSSSGAVSGSGSGPVQGSLPPPTSVPAQDSWPTQNFKPIAPPQMQSQNSKTTTTTSTSSPVATSSSSWFTDFFATETIEATVESRLSQKNCESNYEKEINFGKVVYTLVVGGELAGKDEFPFMAALGWKRADGEFEFNCGGFLVSKNFVLTAAHCTNLGGAAPDIVRIGGDSLTLNTSDPDILIERLYIHPNYTTGNIYNDIALIKMTQDSDKLQACLWAYDDILANYTIGTAIGYGSTQFAGARSNNLLKANLQFIANENCSDFYKAQSEFPMGLISSQLCAGDPNLRKDTCQGDSGGPILISSFYKTPYVVGLTSFGDGCAGPSPSIYTRISSFVDWIESIVWTG